MSLVQKEALPSPELQDHAFEQLNPFRSMEDNPSQRNCQNQLSHPSLSHREQECQESLIPENIYIQQNWNEGITYL